MKLLGYQLFNYKCVKDSQWIEVTPLTVFVGKNESGKTTLLKGLHKVNPFRKEPYNINQEWPRGRRIEREPETIVCKTSFELEDDQINEINSKFNTKYNKIKIKVSANYNSVKAIDSVEPVELEDLVNIEDFEKLTPIINQIHNLDSTEEAIKITKIIKESFENVNTKSDIQDMLNNKDQTIRDLDGLVENIDDAAIKAIVNQSKGQYINLMNQMDNIKFPNNWLETYLMNNLPNFIYMSDYRIFNGSARLDEILVRKNENRLTEEDKTLLMIFKLSGLSLEDEVSKGNSVNREQRQYDLDDAGKTLTNIISERMNQYKYEIQFRADGHLFYTFLKDDRDPALIKLEERSKGTQWFFSFDLMFMHESQGTFKNCVILLDEPGLHLHPGAQKDLLKRLEAYAEGNTLIYSTHLPFMINLEYPERIRVLNEDNGTTIVSDNLVESQVDAKLVLQAALGMTGRQSYLISEKNLVVEGVDDYWFLINISRLLSKNDNKGLHPDIYITPAGGASEAVYIATFMIGQDLDVVTLFDADKAGHDAEEKLLKKWLLGYKDGTADILNLGQIKETKDDFLIEDIFPIDFYLDHVKETYKKELDRNGITEISLVSDEIPLIKKVEKFFKLHDISFNKGSVAKRIRKTLSNYNEPSDLPPETYDFCEKLFEIVNKMLINS